MPGKIPPFHPNIPQITDFHHNANADKPIATLLYCKVFK